MWPEIVKQLNKPRRRYLPRTRTGWLIALLITVLTVGVTAATVDRLLRIGGDSGLEAVDQQGLITHLGVTKTDGNISVTLDYAYADANRITVGYVLDALVKPDDPVALGSIMIYPVDGLRDDQGHDFVGVAGGGGGGGGGGGDEPTPTMVMVSTSHETNYDVFESLGTPNELHLTLQVDVYKNTAGGGMLTPDTDEKLATFEFPFTIPFYPGLEMKQPQTASTAGIDMTLQRFVVTPSMARALLCFNQPPPLSADRWSPNLSLRVNGKDVTLDPIVWQFDSNTVGLSIPPDCLVYALTQALSPDTGDWEITVPDLYTRALDGKAYEDYLAARLQQYGVEMIPQPQGGYGYGKPDSMTYDEMSQIMHSIDQEVAAHINGPWVFKFNLGS